MNHYKWLLILFTLLPLSACKWNDDFRGRQRPQYVELPAKPTLNADSEQYVGDKVAKEVSGKPATSTAVPIPELDQRSPIPELPEHPVGAFN